MRGPFDEIEGIHSRHDNAFVSSVNFACIDRGSGNLWPRDLLLLLNRILDVINLMTQVAILFVVISHCYQLAIVSLDLPIVVGRDSEDHSIPFVNDALGQVLHLRHIRSIKRVRLDRTCQLLTIILQRVRLYVQSVDHFQDLLNNFDVRVSAVRQRV